MKSDVESGSLSEASHSSTITSCGMEITQLYMHQLASTRMMLHCRASTHVGLRMVLRF